MRENLPQPGPFANRKNIDQWPIWIIRTEPDRPVARTPVIRHRRPCGQRRRQGAAHNLDVVGPICSHVNSVVDSHPDISDRRACPHLRSQRLAGAEQFIVAGVRILDSQHVLNRPRRERLLRKRRRAHRDCFFRERRRAHIDHFRRAAGGQGGVQLQRPARWRDQLSSVAHVDLVKHHHRCVQLAAETPVICLQVAPRRHLPAGQPADEARTSAL